MRPIIALLFLAAIVTSCEKPEKAQTASGISAKQIEGHWYLKNITVADEDESQALTADWKPISYEFLSNGQVNIYVNNQFRKTQPWAFDAQKDQLSFTDLFNTPFVGTVMALDSKSLVIESLAVIEGTTRAEKADFYFTR